MRIWRKGDGTSAAVPLVQRYLGWYDKGSKVIKLGLMEHTLESEGHGGCLYAVSGLLV